jgi:NAD(P)-dependent dehydrogenase (short-subunit alcohol dehydrogenase family)
VGKITAVMTVYGSIAFSIDFSQVEVQPNVFGAFLSIREFLSLLWKSEAGRIVNTSSSSVRFQDYRSNADCEGIFRKKQQPFQNLMRASILGFGTKLAIEV